MIYSVLTSTPTSTSTSLPPCHPVSPSIQLHDGVYIINSCLKNVIPQFITSLCYRVKKSDRVTAAFGKSRCVKGVSVEYIIEWMVYCISSLYLCCILSRDIMSLFFSLSFSYTDKRNLNI